MSAIVATLLYVPLGLALALGFRLFGISLDALVTFGGAFSTFGGLFVWWLVDFVAACAYASWVFPWGIR